MRYRVKWMNLYLITLIFLLSTDAYSSDYNRVIDALQTQTGLEHRAAEKLFLIINYFAEGVQTNLTYLASSRDSYYEKEPVINSTIEKYFESRKSQIQVSSLSRNSIFSYNIHTYLNRIAQMRGARYSRVELFFKPDYLGIGRIEKLHNGGFELSVSMKQIFRGWREGRIIYQDETRKKFRLIFILQNGEPEIKINEILVSETIELDMN